MRFERRFGGTRWCHRSTHRGCPRWWCGRLLPRSGTRSFRGTLLLHHWTLYRSLPSRAWCSCNSQGHLHGNTRMEMGRRQRHLDRAQGSASDFHEDFDEARRFEGVLPSGRSRGDWT
eukprot:symbB.v1.2.004908.t1/scaffold263.1/size248082/9